MNIKGSINLKWVSVCVLMAFTLFAYSAKATATPTYLDLSQTPLTIIQQGIDPNILFLMDDTNTMQLEWLGIQVPFGFTDTSGNFQAFHFGYPVGSNPVYGSGSVMLTDVVPGFGPYNIYGAQFRSSYVNANYYNPTQTYTPWACASPYPESSSQTNVTETATKGNPDCHWDSNVNLWVMPDAAVAANGASVDGAFLNPYEDSNASQGVRALDVWNDNTSGNDTPGNGYIGDSKGSNGLTWYIVVPGTGGAIAAQYETWNSSYPATFSGDGTDATVATLGFWPAVYWNYIGTRPATSTDLDNIANYQEVQICPQTLSVNSNGNTGTCTPPPTLPSSISSSDYYHTYINADGDYVYIEGDGTEVSRSYADEMQNFANWYTYYRSRISMARAGASIAFMNLPTNFRVDFGTVSQETNGSNPELNNTEPFEYANSNRQDFLQRFFQQPISNSTTPLRQALQGVGQWLSKQPGSSAPWGTSAAEQKVNNNANYLTCRANYTVLVTSGIWNGSSPKVGNVDGTAGPVNTAPNGSTLGYTPANPYQDSNSDTLGDVAMAYWETDLQSKMINDVPTTGEDPAFWQHMVTFSIGLGATPTLVQAYMQANPGVTEQGAQQAVYNEIAGAPQAGPYLWPVPGANLDTDIDDLWHAAVDGHGSFLSAQNPQDFESALAETLQNIVTRTASGSSVATNTQKAGQVRTDTQVYQALYHPLNWWGQLLAEPILTGGSNNQPTIGTTANWDASCVLTGGSCPAETTSTGTVPTVSVESPSSRVILTDNGTQGVPFEWDSLSSAEQTLLNGTDNLGQDRLDYLRGDRTNELNGEFRTRTSVLGDIVHSSPVWVGYVEDAYPTTSGQPTQWEDDLYQSINQPENAPGVETFAQHESYNWSRLNVVYDGANDGMLHGFEAGQYTMSSGSLTYDTSSTYPNGVNNDGKEVLAFVPQTVFDNINAYTSTNYQSNHHYYVDATPGVGDVFYNGSWKTWLADGLGAGGKELFVLNINNPGNFTESSTNAANTVIADWTPANLTCVNDNSCAQDLGDTFGTPQIRRFHNGDWGIIWGNGYNSTNGVAGIFIGLIDPGTGTISVYWLSTGYGPAEDPLNSGRADGIAYANAADLDGDHIVDYVYAGDLFGNVWRFNLTSTNPLDWHVSTYGKSTPTPLFTASNASPYPQSITTKVQIVSIPSGLSQGQPQNRLLVLFGTGKLLEPQDGTANTTAQGVQSLYGIWDWDMGSWDNGYTTTNNVTVPADSIKYAYLSPTVAISRTNLEPQTITNEQFSTNSSGIQVGLRTTSQNTVQWADLTYNGTAGTQYGWYLDLVSPVYNNQGEMVVYNPDVQSGVFVVNTTILGQQGLTCGYNDNGGWTMALDPRDGAMLEFNAFAINNITDYNGSFDAATLESPNVYSGVTVGAVGSPAYITWDGKTYMVVSTSAGQTKLIQTGLGVKESSMRINWRELR